MHLNIRRYAVLIIAVMALLAAPMIVSAATTTVTFYLHAGTTCSDTGSNRASVIPGASYPSFSTFNNIASSLQVPAGVYDATVYASQNYSTAMYELFSGPGGYIAFCSSFAGQWYDNNAESARSR